MALFQLGKTLSSCLFRSALYMGKRNNAANPANFESFVYGDSMFELSFFKSE